MRSYLLGFDIGGTKCAVVLGAQAGQNVEVLAREAFPTAETPGPEAALQRLVAEARALMARHGLKSGAVEAAGISCGGPLDSRNGLVLSPPNLPGWDSVPVVAVLTEALGLPVALQNDANAGALAEWRWGAGQGTRSLVFLTFGTGMGAGLILDGRLHAGRNDLAGEVGHVRLAESGPVGFGKAGSFEGYCSGGGIARLAQAHVRAAWARGETVRFCPDEQALASLDARRVAEAAWQHDPVAEGVFATSGHYLGRGLALLMDVLNPDVIVIGGMFSRCQDLLRPTMEKALEAEALPGARCPVVPALLGEAIGDYAALAVAVP